MTYCHYNTKNQKYFLLILYNVFVNITAKNTKREKSCIGTLFAKKDNAIVNQ